MNIWDNSEKMKEFNSDEWELYKKIIISKGETKRLGKAAAYVDSIHPSMEEYQTCFLLLVIFLPNTIA